MDILEKEIQIALNPFIKNEERDKSTHYFNDFYNSLDSIFLSLRLYLLSNNLTIKFASSIILHHTINKIWPIYKDDQTIKEKIHNQIIKCILNKGDHTLFSYFLYSIGPILSTDIEIWPNYHQFYNVQISNSTAVSIAYPTIISSLTIEYLPYNFIKSKLIYFLSLAQFSFGVDDSFLIIFTSRLISKLFTKLQQEDLFHLTGPFEFVMKKWGYSIIEGNDSISKWLNQTVNEVINNRKIPFTAETFLNFLMDLSSRDLTMNSLHLLYHNIIDFLRVYGSEIEGIENIIEIILSTSSSLFQDDFLSGQSEMLYVLNAFDTILKTANAEDSISYLFEYKEDVNEILSDDSLLSELVSYLFCVLHCVEITFELCIPYIQILVNLVINNMSNTNVCVQEISLEIVGEICRSLHYLHDFDNSHLTSAFFGPLFTLLKSNNRFVIFRSIRSLIELLHVASIEPDFVGSLIEALYNLYDNDINKIYVLEAISSVVFSAGTSVRKYSMKIYKTAKKALHSNDLFLIATAIESLSNLFFYCHDISDSKATEIFNVLTSFAGSTSGDIRSSVAFGFRVFLKNKEKWKSIIYPSFGLIIKFINETLDLFIGESTRSCLLDVLRLVKVIVKHYSPLIQHSCTSSSNKQIGAKSDISNSINRTKSDTHNNTLSNNIIRPKSGSNSSTFSNIIIRTKSDNSNKSDSGNDCMLKWFNCSLECFNTSFIPLHIAAISLSAILYEKRANSFTQRLLETQTKSKNEAFTANFFALLEKDFDDDSPYISSAAINAFAKLTDLGVADFTIDRTIEKVVNLLCKYDSTHFGMHKSSSSNGGLSKQILISDENHPDHHYHHHGHSIPMLVRKSIYNYLSVISSVHSERFPLGFLASHFQAIEDEAEVTLYYYAIENLYFSTVKFTKNLTINDKSKLNLKESELIGRYSYLNGESRSIIYDGFNRCDLFNWPSALISLDIITRELYKNGLIQLCQEILPIFERFTESLFKTQFTHQTSYFQTVYTSMSIVLTFCCAKMIDVLKWVPLVIKKFPVKSEFGFADSLFHQITDLYTIDPLKLNPFAPHLLYIFVGALAEPDDRFELYNFSRETLQNVVDVVKKMEKLNPQTFVIISTSFLDVNSKPMFEKRMDEFSSQKS